MRQAAPYGGSTVPASVHGPQRATLQAERAVPTRAPSAAMAPSAYRLHDGTKRQRAPARARAGERVAW